MNAKVWPIGITVFLVFVIVINICFAIIASKTSVGEIEYDSYQKGLNYQSEIELQENANILKLSVDFKKTNDGYVVTLKKEGVFINAQELVINLKRADEKNLDIEANQRCNAESCFIELAQLKSGLWLFNLNGKLDNKSFLIKGTTISR